MRQSRAPATGLLTVGQALVKFLSRQYSERDGHRRRLIPAIFGIFGHGNVSGLGQALESAGADLPHYQSRNEQSMVHTASGYAKAALRTATLACTSSIGPGATNMVTGAATATINRLPVLLLPSDYYATRHQGNVLQQIEHPLSADVSVNDCFRPVSRFFDRISRPEQLLTALPEAMRVLTDPAETGAVTISLPQDVQAHAYRYPAHFFAERTWRIERRPPAAARVAEALALLERSLQPLIVAGGGVHYSAAWDALAELAAFGIPVAETYGGKGALRSAREWSLGGHGVDGTTAAAHYAGQADLVIAVGTRLGDFATGSNSLFRHPDVRFVSINVSAHDAHKNGSLPVVADARAALRALAEGCRARAIDFTARRSRIAELMAEWQEVKTRDAYAPRAGEAMGEGEVIRVLNQEARPGDSVVAAAGAPVGNLLKLWGPGVRRRLLPGVRVLVHGLGAAGGARGAHAAAGGRGIRLPRRRRLPAQPDGVDDRAAGGAQDHGGGGGQPRLPGDPPAADGARRPLFRHRVPQPRGHRRRPPSGRRVRGGGHARDRGGDGRARLSRQHARRGARGITRGARRAPELRDRGRDREAPLRAGRRRLVGHRPRRGQPQRGGPRPCAPSTSATAPPASGSTTEAPARRPWQPCQQARKKLP